MASFAAEGWQVQSLRLYRLDDGALGLLARPGPDVLEVASGATEAVPPSPAREVLVATGQSGSLLPEEFHLAPLPDTRGDLPAARLSVDGHVLLAVDVKRPGRSRGRLGAEFLARYLVGWDGPNRTLYLADAPTLAQNR